jgi:Na+-translocating ferredoxin:NAD+ oxidoreductase subunit B
MSPIIVPVIVISGLGLVMASLLAVGRKIFYVEVDPRHEKIMEILPGANCGGCGYPGCSGYADALVKGAAPPTACPPGGEALATELGKLLGVEVSGVEKKIALIACAGDSRFVEDRAHYLGIADCAAAQTIQGGIKRCAYGCLGLGSCKEACPFDAIAISDKGLAYVIEDRCTGCGNCVPSCPRNLISMVPADEPVHVLCRNPEKAKAVKEVCSVGCTGCKLCVKRSARFDMEGPLARVNYEKDDEIPEETYLACTQGSIFDRRQFSLEAWLTEPSVRDEYNRRTEEWKAAEKARKAAAKKPKEKKANADKEGKKKDIAKPVGETPGADETKGGGA